MKAAVFLGKEKIEIQSKEIPTPHQGEVLIRVKACGICGTDQHIYHGYPGSANVVPPRILGHELSGVVEQVGDGVRSLKIGDRVTIDPNIYCGNCEYCRSGRAHLCDHLSAIGVTRDGGMAEYCVMPEANTYTLPDSLSFEMGAMIEPLGCVLHGIQQLQVWPGASVLIIGGGYIGQMMLQMAKLYGAYPVAVSEPDPHKRELASSFGADITYNPAEASIAETFDIVIECVGRKETMEQAVTLAKKGGQVLLFGVASPDIRIQVSPFEIFSKELKLYGSFINPYTHEQAIALVEQKRIVIDPLLSHTFTLDEIPRIMREYSSLHVTKGIIRL
jgi:L-iditol 2-dehydrogenase